MSYFLSSCLLILPFYFNYSFFVPYQHVRDILFITLAACFAMLSTWVELRKVIPALFLVAVAFFTIYHHASTTTILQYFPFIAAMVFIAILDPHIIDDKQITIIAYATVIIASCFLILNYFGIDPMSLVYNDLQYIKDRLPTKEVQIAGNMAHPIPSCVLIVSLIPFVPWLLPLGILAVVITNSATGLLALIASCGIMIFPSLSIRMRWIACLSVFSLVIAGCLLDNEGFFFPGERLPKWEMVITYIRKNPIFGYGLGHFRDNFYMASGGTERWFHVHNEILELMYAFGALGVAGFAYLASMIRVTRKNLKYFACLVSLLVSSMFYFTFHNTPLVLWSIVCFTVLTKKEFYEMSSFRSMFSK